MKTKIYLIIIVALLAIVGITLFNANNKNNGEKEKAFKVEEFEKVTEIIFTDRLGEKMSMKKEGENWILNDKYPVRMHLFNEMKEALTKMEAISPVPSLGRNTVIEQMVNEAVKVEVYKGKKKDKVIFVGGPNLRNNASHMFLEIKGKASKQIYNVGIPGFRGYLTTRFLVNENEWRSKEIFSYLPSEVKQIEVKYFNRGTYDDFILTNENNNFTVEINGKKNTGDEVNVGNVVNYLKRLDAQQVMAYSFDKPEDIAFRDSLLAKTKFAEFTIIDKNDKKTHTTIVDMPLNEGSKQQYDPNGNPMTYDVDFQYIIFGEKNEWGVISNSRFGILLVSPYLFLTNNIKP